MNKAEFNQYLSEKLRDLPQSDIEKSLNFYCEIIDDRMEDGMSEEEAVAAVGDIDKIVKEILLDAPLANLMKAKLKPRGKMHGWEIALLVIGFPLWFPLLMAFGAVFLSVYVVIWSLIISLYAVDLSFAVAGVAGVIQAFVLFTVGVPSGLFMLGCAIFSAGIAIFAFFGVRELTGMLIRLTGSFMRSVKSMLIKKESV